MAKETYLGANVEVTTDSFAGWINKTNQVRDDMGRIVVTVTQLANTEPNTVNAGITTGNAAIAGVLTVNTMAVSADLRGGTVLTPATLSVTSNVHFNDSANVWITSNTDHVSIDSNNTVISSNVVFDGGSTKTIRIDVANTTVNTGSFFVNSNAQFSGASANVTTTSLNVTANANFSGANVRITSANTTIGDAATDGFTVNAVSDFNANVNIDGILTQTANAVFSGGNVSISSALTTIGDATTDLVVINAYLNSDLIPNATTIDLGSDSKPYGNVHTRYVYADVDVEAQGNVVIKGSATRVLKTLSTTVSQQALSVVLENNAAASYNPLIANNSGIHAGANTTYDLGSTAINWRNLYVKDTAVANSAVISNVLTVNTQANTASLMVRDLTATRIPYVGTAGEIVDSANLVFSGTQLSVTGAASISGNETVGGTLGVTGAATFANTVSVTGAVTASNTVSVTGATSIANTLSVTGDATFSANVTLSDSDYLRIGTSQDLIVYHDGSNSYIKEQGTGNLKIDTNNQVDITTSNSTATETMATFVRDGAVTLYYDNTPRIATTSSGASVTGVLAVSSNETVGGTLGVTGAATFANTISVTGAASFANTLAVTGAATFSNNAIFGDGKTIILGDSEDMLIYHDGLHSYIADMGTGNLKLDASQLDIQTSNSTATETMATFARDGAVTLYNNNIARIATTGTGASVTGVLAVSGNETVGGTLGVTGAATFTNTVSVTGATTLSSTLGVVGTTTASAINASGLVSVTNTTDATSNTAASMKTAGGLAVAKKLYVGQETFLQGNVTVSSGKTLTTPTAVITTANVTGNETVGGTLGVTGAAGFANTVSVTGAVSFANTLVVTGNTSFANTISVTGAAEFANTISVTGDATFSANVNLSDSDYIRVGTGADLLIYHDGSHSYITDAGTGNLKLDASQLDIQTSNATATETMATFVRDGAVTLYHNNSAKIATAASGVSVTGNTDVSNYVTAPYANVTTLATLASANVTGELITNSTVRLGANTSHTTTAKGSVSVEGNLTVLGSTTLSSNATLSLNVATMTTATIQDLTVNGNTVIGSDSTDRASIKASLEHNLIAVNNLYDLGSTTNIWKTIYANNVVANVAWASVTGKPDPVVTVTLTGDVTGTGNATLTDLANGSVSITTTIAQNSVALGTDTTGNYMINVSAGDGITVSHTQGEGSTATVSHADTSSQASVNNAAGTVIQDVTLDTYGHVTGLTSANLDARYSTSTFTTIAVSGQSNVVADAREDTLTFASGGIVSITTNANTDTITISATEADTLHTVTTRGNTTTNNITVNDINARDLTLSGNLTVSGTTTYVNTTQLNIGDNIIGLNADYTGSTPSENAGIEVERGTLANTALLWNETSDRWTFTNDGTNYHNIPISSEYDKYTSWTIRDGDTTTYTITSGDTLQIASGTYITSNFTADDVLTISHDNTTRTDTTTGNTAPGSGGTFTAVDSVITNAQGHVTAINVKTVTLPTSDNYGSWSAKDGDTTTYTITSGDILTFAEGTGMDVNFTADDVLTFTNTDRGSSQNIFKNVSVLDSSAYTFAATGIIVADNNNDTMYFVSGDGIDVNVDVANDAITWVNTDKGSSQAIFKNVAVSGQTTVVADSNNDTLTLVGGNYITITTNATTDSVTFTHDNTTRTNTTTGNTSPGYGGTFTAIDSITTNTQGHVTAVNTKTVTIPASDNTNTTYDLTAVANTGANAAIVRLKDSANANDDVIFTGSGTVTMSSNATHVIATGAATNLSTTANTTVVVVASSTGTNTTIAAANATAAGVLTSVAQTIAGTKTFNDTISGSIDGNAATVTNGVYTTGNQTIAGTKTFSSTIAGSITGSANTANYATVANELRTGNGGSLIIDGLAQSNPVNYLTVRAANTAQDVLIATAGTDTNIGLLLQTKGTGAITIDTGTGAGDIHLKPGSSNLKLYDDNSTHYYRFVTGDRTANYDINLPAGSVTLVSGTMVPTTGTGATGTWGISITGNAATATSATSATTATTASSVTNGVYTTGNQTIGGVKTFSANAAFSANVSISGDLSVTGDISSASDARLKENVHTIDSALDKVVNLRGVYYNKIGETERKLGVIAQEVEAIVPEVVNTDADGMKSVAYANMIGLLIEAIRELKTEIEELKVNK